MKLWMSKPITVKAHPPYITVHSQIIAMNEQEQKCLQAFTKKAVHAEDQLSLKLSL